MGSSNTTPNYNLSQFVGTDKPAWLQDYNGDMLKIDTGINAAKVAADGAQNTANSAQNTADNASSAITNTINPAISSLNTTVGNQGGSINTIQSLIGNGTPTTTDQTIIGAINEINANVIEISEEVSSVETYSVTMNANFTSYLSGVSVGKWYHLNGLAVCNGEIPTNTAFVYFGETIKRNTNFALINVSGGQNVAVEAAGNHGTNTQGVISPGTYLIDTWFEIEL